MYCTWIVCIVYIVSFSINTTEAQDCDFDGSIVPFCGWTLGTDSNGSRWKLTDSLQNIGQNTDHIDPGAWQFVYLDAVVDSGAKATLTSPIITILSDINFKFMYYMHGTEYGTLNVYIQDSDDTDNERKLIYTKRGDFGDAWNEGSVHISVPVKSRIIIEGVKASGHRGGVIGLDDFMVTNTSSIGNGSCDFETDDICGYRQVLSDEFDWVRLSGEIPILGTGPPYDHTFNNASIAGFYMYTDASSHKEGNAARMSTPAIGPSSAICLSFWYYIYGDSSSKRTVGSLNVYKTDINSDILTYSLLSLHGSQGNKWYEMKIDFPSNQEFQIVFEAIRGNSEQSDIAIDDVKVVRHSFCNGSIVPSSFSHPRPDGVKMPQTPSTRTFNPMVTTGNIFMSTDTSQIKLHNHAEWHMNRRIVTLIIACGLSFWTVVFSLIFISIFRSYRLREKELFYQLERQEKDEKSSVNQLVEGNQSMHGLDLNIDTDTDPDEDVDVTELGVVGGIDFLSSVLKSKLVFAAEKAVRAINEKDVDIKLDSH